MPPRHFAQNCKNICSDFRQTNCARSIAKREHMCYTVANRRCSAGGAFPISPPAGTACEGHTVLSAAGSNQASFFAPEGRNYSAPCRGGMHSRCASARLPLLRTLLLAAKQNPAAAGKRRTAGLRDIQSAVCALRSPFRRPPGAVQRAVPRQAAGSAAGAWRRLRTCRRWSA